jgi:hypothetical protein
MDTRSVRRAGGFVLTPQRLLIAECLECQPRFSVSGVHRCPYVGLCSFEPLISSIPVSGDRATRQQLLTACVRPRPSDDLRRRNTPFKRSVALPVPNTMGVAVNLLSEGAKIQKQSAVVPRAKYSTPRWSVDWILTGED